MDSPYVSIICIVNNQSQFDGFKESLESQNFKAFELIPVMNLNNEWDSARAALKCGVTRATGNVLVFSHPDIRFSDGDSLGDIIAHVNALPEDTGVCGAAGAVKNEKGGRNIVSSIVQGADKVAISSLPCGEDCKEIVQAQTVDECFFTIEKGYFDEHPFSDRKGWHLYAVEACLNAIKNGRKNYVVPARLWHMSDGKSLDASYVKQVGELCRTEKQNFDAIYTTVKCWKTRGLGPAAYRKYYQMKQNLKRKLNKG